MRRIRFVKMKKKQKKHSYAALWVLLAVALAIVITAAFVDDITFAGHTFKKAPIADLFVDKSVGKADTIAVDSVPVNMKEEVTTDSLPHSLLIFGDSMTYNLALRLAQYAKQNGHIIHAINWDSSNTKIWAEHDTLQYYIRQFRPTQIFISLGSNELYFKNPESRTPYVKKIIEVIDTVPFVWIGPPNWKEDSGINDMLARICGPGRFFRSAGMEFKRKADHIHPTRQSSALWIDSIMRWLPKSAHPFLAEIPSDSVGKANPNIVFLKALNK